MAQLAAAIPYITAASTVLTTAAAVQQSNAQKVSLEAQARARDEEANASAAESQRVAQIERRKARNLMSRARAVAGGGASDPTVVNQLTDIETQGEVNALNAMYSGATQARGYRQGAAMARNEAAAAQTAGTMDAASTALGGGASWYEKYGKPKYGTK